MSGIWIGLLLVGWSKAGCVDGDRDQICTASRSALRALSVITPAFCLAFEAAWVRDRDWWSDNSASVPPSVGLEAAVERLGLPAFILTSEDEAL